ncbi:MAG: two-component sensor histidine kinase [Kineosporiaceae bacterium]|nr:two-component sensor histidine kinase [Aeromicrobium sp.]
MAESVESLRTISDVELSEQLLIAGVIGIVVGAALTYFWRFNEKRQEEQVDVPTPIIPPGADAVLSMLSSSVILIDSSDKVVKASAPAHALGLINGDRLAIDELIDLVRQVRRDGQVREREFTLEVRRTAPRYVMARVAQLNSRLIVILADDRTRERRLESIRRDFVANVSHELKTPIGAIQLLAEAVGEAKDDPASVLRFSARMHTESERLTRLVQQIIDLSRLQQDVMSDDSSMLKVGDLIGEACEHSQTEAERKNIAIASQYQPDLFIHGDRDQIHAAVSNLVENAVTYSPADSKVSVTAKSIDGEIHIVVTDHGIGIPNEELGRIFERFYRVDPARARATGGTGLGLSIVKHVAASNGGRVTVWSEQGQGSSFTLILPAFTPDLDEENL